MTMNHNHPKGIWTVRNERGVALVVAVLIMITATFLGIAAVMTSGIEIRISGNQRCMEKAFYAADAGADRGLAWLLNLGTTPPAKSDLPTMAETVHFPDLSDPSCYSSYRVIDVEYEGPPPPGWEITMFKRLYYRVDAAGGGPANASKEIEVMASYVFPKE